MLAASHVDVGGLAVWAVIAVIFWGVKSLGAFIKKMTDSSSDEPVKMGRHSGQMQRSGKGELSEEERTRRFMEALGLPTQAGGEVFTPPPVPARQREETSTLRPRVENARRGEMPVPPFVAPTGLGRQRELNKRGSTLPPNLPKDVQREAAAARDKLEGARRKRKEEERRRKEVARTEELFRQGTEGYHTVAERVSAIPTERRLLPLELETPRPTAEHLSDELLKLIRSPEGLRSAIILQEVLGPPRGLQREIAPSRMVLP